MREPRDTICALASGPPPAALCVVRISGPRVREIAGQCLKRGCPTPRRAVLDTLIGTQGEALDTGLVVFMPGPGSYTGEDVLELSLHGSRFILRQALERLRQLGARLAEPGEFTRRAFEAGKFDLTQAEAIADLIAAESEAQHRQASQQFAGALSALYSGWQQALTELMALLESGIDFPDEADVPVLLAAPLREGLEGLQAQLQHALADGHISQRLREGFRIVILGAPNVGKSTLLNRFAAREAAIVTPIAGTTRDIIEVRLELGRFLVWLSDTAGLRQTQDLVESEGIRRAHLAAEDADIRLWLYDSASGGPPQDYALKEDDFLIANKADLLSKPQVPLPQGTFWLSAATGEGFEALQAALIERLEALSARVASPLLTQVRHRQAIEEALRHVQAALEAAKRGDGFEFLAENLRAAAHSLASLTGGIDVEQVLGAVFSRFCIGK